MSAKLNEVANFSALALSMLVDVFLVHLSKVLEITGQNVGIDGHAWIVAGSAVYCGNSNIVTRGAVAEHHLVKYC